MATRTVTLDDLSEPAPPPSDADWNDAGVVVLAGLLDDELVADYQDEWRQANGWHGCRLRSDPGALYHLPVGVAGEPWVLDADRPGGWPDCTPYRRYDALARICCHPLVGAVLHDLIGEPAAVHLNLTGWESTGRDWHQDTYLNEPEVGDAYAAVWFALGDVHPGSGPFQYVPGSHRWHVLQRDRFAGLLDLDDPDWPARSEAILAPLVAAEVERRGAAVVDYLPRKGDVLFWHGRLYHRGSKPTLPHAYRPSLIAHYSGVHHRSAMPAAVKHDAGGWYFPLGGEAGVEGNTGR